MSEKLKGIFFILLSLLIFSVNSNISRAYSVNVYTMLATTTFLGVVYLGGYFVVSGQRHLFRPSQSPALLFGVAVAVLVTLITFYSAIRLTTVANTVLLHYTAPIFTVALAVLFLKEPFEWQSIFAVLLSFAGIYLVFGGTLRPSLGLILALASGVSYGVTIVLYKRLVSQGSIYSLSFTVGLLLFVFVSPALFFQLPPLSEFLIMAVLAPGVIVIAPLLYYQGLKAIQAQHASIISYAEILFTSFFGWLFFGEVPGQFALLGGALIIAAGIWAVLRETRPKV
ncbi:DMT family transporter [Candidatus Woesearchaeota archaeon]|nr:DMT family transporter [Candidatus Woesearchaeota archaeon]